MGDAARLTHVFVIVNGVRLAETFNEEKRFVLVCVPQCFVHSSLCFPFYSPTRGHLTNALKFLFVRHHSLANLKCSANGVSVTASLVLVHGCLKLSGSGLVEKGLHLESSNPLGKNIYVCMYVLYILSICVCTHKMFSNFEWTHMPTVA